MTSAEHELEDALVQIELSNFIVVGIVGLIASFLVLWCVSWHCQHMGPCRRNIHVVHHYSDGESYHRLGVTTPNEEGITYSV